jgi:hypothetical protein
MPSRRGGRATRIALALVLAAACIGYTLAWPRFLGRSDESVLLDGARRIVDGQALYRDFFEFITPGSFYLYAGLFAVTGSSFLAVRLLTAAINATSCVLLFYLVCRVAAPLEAALAVVSFVVICLTTFLFASPHWISTMLSLATAAVLLGSDDLRARRVAVAGFLAGLAVSVQQQRGAVLAVWLAAAIVTVVVARDGIGGWRRAIRAVALAALAAGAATLVVVGHAVARSSAREFLDATVLFVVKGYAPANAGRMPWAGVPLISARGYTTWLPVLRILPVFLVIEAVALASALFRRRALAVERVVLLALAIMMALGISYFPDYIHVSFVAPFLFVVAARVVHGCRTAAFWRRGRGLGLVPALLFVAAFAAVAIKARTNLQQAWGYYDEPYESAMGTLDGGRAQGQLVERIRESIPVDANGRRVVFVYPSEPWLYLTVPADNPTPYAIIFRGYNSEVQFARVIETLERRPVDYVVVCGGLLRKDDPILAYVRARYERIAVGGYFNVCSIFARPGAPR